MHLLNLTLLIFILIKIFSKIGYYQLLQMFLKNFCQIAEEYHFSLEYGTLLDPHQQTLDFLQIRQIAENLPKLLQKKMVQKCVGSLSQIDISVANTYEKQVQLRLYLIYIMNSYLYEVRNDQTKSKFLPKQIAVPLYKISKILGMKIGLSIQLAKIWKFKSNKQLNMQEIIIQDLQLVYSFTGSVTQSYFILGSVIAALIFKDIIIASFQINKIILFSENKQLVIPSFEFILKKLLNLNKQVKKLFQKMDANYYYQHVRPYLFGLNQIYFEGIDITQNSIDTRYDNPVTSSGGSAGNDPSFQLFQRLFGIKYNFTDNLSTFWKNIQQKILQGMPTCFTTFIKKCEDSNIRQFCYQNSSSKRYYNKIINEYSNFFRMHSQFILTFLFKPNPHIKQGTAGNDVHVVLRKYQLIDRNIIQ